MPEQKTLEGELLKPPIVKVIIDLYSARMCTLFPETGALACIPFNSWEHFKRGDRRKVKQAHHKLTVLIPEENVILTNYKGELHQKLLDLTTEYGNTGTKTLSVEMARRCIESVSSAKQTMACSAGEREAFDEEIRALEEHIGLTKEESR